MIEILYSNNRNPVPQKLDKPKVGAWINISDPSPEEITKISHDYKLDVDLLNDATDIYETPRIEQEDGNTYVFSRYCYPAGKDIATEPLLVIYTKHHIISIARIETGILERLTKGVEPIATTQKTKTLLQILGAINYSYVKNMYQVNKNLLSIRSRLSKADIKNEYFVKFIDIEENLNEYITALQPQSTMFKNLLNGRFLPLYEEDKDLVEDLLLGANELIDLIKSRLKTISNIRDAYSTIMANNLNSIFKRLTSIGIFMAVPTIVASFYGMNVTIPNENSQYAFWEIVFITAAITALVIYIFKRLKWL